MPITAALVGHMLRSAVALAMFPPLCAAQIRALGEEFVANTFTQGAPGAPAVAIDADGNVVAVWYGQRFDSTGHTDGTRAVVARRIVGRGGRATDFVVDDDATLNISRGVTGPVVALQSDGGAAFAWEVVRSEEEPDRTDIGVRFFDSELRPATKSIRVNQSTGISHNSPALSRLPDGTTFVAWSRRDDRNELRAVGRILDSDGVAVTDEFLLGSRQVRSSTPYVTVLDSTHFIAAFVEDVSSDTSERQIRIQRFDGSGVPAGASLVAGEAGAVGPPAIASTGDGSFLVVWEGRDEQPGGLTGIFAQGFDSDGQPRAGAVQINAFSPGWQRAPNVAADGRGGYVALWDSSMAEYFYGQDGSETGIYGRRLHPDGSPHGLEFQANNVTLGEQGILGLPREGLAARDGLVVAAWHSQEIAGPLSQEIAIRRFRVRPRRSALCGDAHSQDLTLGMADALSVLKASVGLDECLACICDTDRSGLVETRDAQRVAARAVGHNVELACPRCPAGAESPAGEPVLP